MTLGSTVGLTVSSLLGLLVYLSRVSVFVSTFSTRGAQLTFCLFYPTTTAMHQSGFQLHPSQSSFPETLCRTLFSLECSEEKQGSVRTFSVSTGSPKWVHLSHPFSPACCLSGHVYCLQNLAWNESLFPGDSIVARCQSLGLPLALE